MRSYVNLLIWLITTIEVQGSIFSGLWSTWYTPVSTFFFTPIAHVIPWDAMLGIAWVLTRGKRGERVKAVRYSIKIASLALLATLVWGLSHGGSWYQAIFQLRPFIISLFLAQVVANVYLTQADIRSLGRTLAVAAVYRAFTAVGFWFFVAKDMKEPPIAMTDHADTVLFVVGLFLFLVNAIEKKNITTTICALLAGIPIVGAIVVNNRRLAWLALAVGLVMIYVLLPKGRTRTRISRGFLAMSPLIIAYIAIGWGHPTGIFEPVGSISTMFGEHQDTSSVMRDIENYNLTKTLKSNPWLGLGWGQEYIEEVRAYDISAAFPQYRYLPHNSLLGTIAFTGMFGFAGIWQLLVVCVYLHALVYRGTVQIVPRVASMCCLVAVAVIELQMWGDLGFNHPMVTSMLGLAVGLAARLPVMTGVWPQAMPKATAVIVAYVRRRLAPTQPMRGRM